ncbi:MAG: VWA domain-containing protein [Pseudomonadota bacterium]|nr:VWA domain-containing protein [Pseudomonadota bacterium]
MRAFYALVALSLVLSCNPDTQMLGATQSKDNPQSGDGTGLSPEVEQAVTEENISKNEPPTVIVNPKDISGLGIDLNSALEKKTESWTANALKPDEKLITEAGPTYSTISLSTASSSSSSTQVMRQRYSKTLAQTGQPSSTHKQTFQSKAAGILDILLVIDSSGSMRDEQQALKDNMPNLLSQVNESDWQISVVNTDPKCDFRPPISKTTPSYKAKYMNNVLVGTYGGTELAVYNAIRSMKGECANSAWQRDGSTIAVIIVTDEPHQCRSEDQEVCATAGKLQEYLHSIRAASDVKIFGLVTGNGWKSESMFADVGDITDKSKYDSIFKAISSSVNDSLKSSYELDYLPDGITFNVTVDGTAVSSSNYTRSGKVITFKDGVLPEDKDVAVVITYSYGFRQYVYDMTLDHMPLNQADKLIVTVAKPGATDTTLVYGSGFNLNNKQLSFTGCNQSGCTQLPAGATATVQYQENTALNKKFVIAGSSNHHAMMNLVVKVNGTAQANPADYSVQTETNGDKSILFTSSPPEAAKIDVSYTYLTTLTYSFIVSTANVSNSITCKDHHTQSRTIPCSYNAANKQVTFTDAAATDKVLVVEYLSKGSTALDHELNSDYIGSSVVVRCELGDGTTRNLIYSISSNVVSLDEDDFNACVASAKSISTSYAIKLEYNVRLDDQDHFTFQHEVFAEHKGKYKFIYVVVEIDTDGDGAFSVVNHKEFNFVFDYDSVDDARVAFLKTLPDNTKVRATVYLLPH